MRLRRQNLLHGALGLLFKLRATERATKRKKLGQVELAPPVHACKHRNLSQRNQRMDESVESSTSTFRLARCLDCRHGTVIVHFSRVLQKWVDDSGRFHTRHLLEMPPK